MSGADSSSMVQEHDHAPSMRSQPDKTLVKHTSRTPTLLNPGLAFLNPNYRLGFPGFPGLAFLAFPGLAFLAWLSRAIVLAFLNPNLAPLELCSGSLSIRP